MAVDPARTKSLFLAALDLASRPERAAWLDGACGPDAELRNRVEALLAADEGGGPMPRFPAGRVSAPDLAAARETSRAGDRMSPAPSQGVTVEEGPYGDGPAEAGYPQAQRAGGFVPGQTIAGRYVLCAVLGAGGMGAVYRADQTQPVRRQVALKLITAGQESRAALARFHAERQALTLMDHPNIVRVYDGGTTEAGQSFLAMELVGGVPLTEYCDQHRLPIRARLELFVSVCHAVQYAHQKLIIHRELKPGSVLIMEVDGRPTPKVIDFGVAKASLTLSAAVTGTYAGITIFQARTANAQLVVSGSGAVNVTGIVYAAAALVNISGGAAIDTFGTSLIAADLLVTGSGELLV